MTEADLLLTSITEFDFLATFTILYTLLRGLEGITQQLQGSSMDLYKAYGMVSIYSGALLSRPLLV